MKKFLLGILVTITAFGIPSACKAQSIQYLGTKDNIMVTRNIAREDSAHEFAITDTSKHVSRPGRMVSFLGQPYWWDGTRWYRLRGDTTTIPGQVNADWNATSGVALILNKPTLATVATSGSYTDLINPPTIPPGQVSSDWNAVSGFTRILNKPRMIDSIWKVPGEDSFRIRVRNNDNTFRTFALKDSVGGGGGSGTVLDVAVGNLSPIFGATVANASTHPSISFTLSNAAAHSFLGNTSGSTAAPSYSTLTVADLPNSIPISKTLLTVTTGTGITLTANNLSLDTLNTLASIYDVSLKQDKLNGTGYLKEASGTSNYLTPTQVTADLNPFTTTLQGLVPAPGTVTGKVLSDNGTWVVQSGGSGGGISTASGDVSGTAVGTNLPLTLTTVNSNVFASNTLLKHTVNAKGLITSAVAATAADITNTLTYIPFSPTDTISKLATKYDLTKLDTVLLVPYPFAGAGTTTLFGRNDTIYMKRLVNAIQNNDSTITVGNLIASNNLSDIGNKNSALNTILPTQTGNAGKVLTTDGNNTSWVTGTGGSGTTNISVTQSSTSALINSSTGSSGTLPLVNYNLSGLMSPGDKKRLDSTINLANTRVGDSIAYLNITGDTIWFKGINMTASGNTLTWTKNHTQQSLSYNADINLAHANSWSALQTFGNTTTTGTVTYSGTTFNAFNTKLDQLVQDTTTGIQYRAPYIPIDLTGAPNGGILTWNTGTNTATFQAAGTGGTVTTFSAGTASPLFSTTVTNASTTPNLAFTVTPAAANTIFANATGSSAAPTYVHPSLTGSLFNNQGTTTTVLKGNPAGNLSFGSVILTTDVSGQLPIANAGVPSGGSTAQALVKNTGTNYDYAWTNIVNSISGTTNQVIVSTATGTPVISLPQNINTAANTIFGSQTLSTGDLNFSRTDQAYANITRPNTVGAKGLNFSVVGGGALDNFTVTSISSNFTNNVGISGNLNVVGTTTLTGKTTFGNSSTAGASVNLPVGGVPTTPVNGNLINDGSHLYFTSGGVNIDLLASGSGITSLNGQTGATQTFATGGSGTDFNISSTGNVHTFNIPDAGNAIRGVINAGAQSIYGIKTFVNAPILTTSSSVGQVWKATGTGGQGGWGTDNSIYNSDGTLTANRTLSGGNFTLALGQSSSPLSGLSIYSTTGANVTGGQYNNGSGSQFKLLGSTINNPITGSGGTVTDYSSSAMQSNSLTATNPMTYTNASTLLVEGAPVSSTNVTITNPLSLKVATGKSQFNGTVQIVDGTQGSNKVLTSDASGNGSWQALNVPNLVYSEMGLTQATNTTSAVSLFPSGFGSNVLPAGFFTAGKTIKVHAEGTIGTTTSPGNLIFTVTLGALALNGAAITNLANSLSSQHWYLDLTITCPTPGTSGVIYATGALHFGNGPTGAQGVTELIYDMTPVNAGVLNTNNPATLDITAQWQTANINNSFKCYSTTIQSLN